MSGRRCKALRKKYKERYGRPVEKTSYKQMRWGMYEYMISQWRRLKKAYKRNPAAFL